MSAAAVFTCPHCGVETEVTADVAGQRGHCFNCGKPITILAPRNRSVPPPGNVTLAEQDTDEASAPKTVAISEAGNRVPREAKRPTRTLRSSLLVPALVGLIVMLFLGGSLAGLLTLTAGAGRTALFPRDSRRAAVDQLRSIQLALEQYHVRWNAYPPACTFDANGRPLHSWRTLLLPYLGQDGVYSQLDLTKPWDDPINANLAQWLPNPYHSPEDLVNIGTADTSYMVISGDETMFPQGVAKARTDAADRSPPPLLVIEVYGSNTPWMEPTDLMFGSSKFVIDGDAAQSPTAGGQPVLAVLADGRIVTLDHDTPPSFLRALATSAGRENVTSARMTLIEK